MPLSAVLTWAAVANFLLRPQRLFSAYSTPPPTLSDCSTKVGATTQDALSSTSRISRTRPGPEGS